MIRKLRDLFMKSVLRTKTSSLGSRTSSLLLQFINPIEIFSHWWTSPFNGQARRLYNVVALSHELEPTCAIETGTFMGSTTYLFLGMPTVTNVFSIESDLENYKLACQRYKSLISDRFSLLHGDSKELLKEILSKLDPKSARLICYLDAHWEGDIPTIQELNLLADWGGQWFAVVDDFKIPVQDANGYGFDQYGDSAVDISIIPNNYNLQVYVPTESAINETGAKRGTAYIFSHNYKPSDLLTSRLKMQKLFTSEEES